jgi:hypothetical protein
VPQVSLLLLLATGRLGCWRSVWWQPLCLGMLFFVRLAKCIRTY